MQASGNALPPVIRLRDVRLHHGRVVALAGIDLDLPGACTVGLIGPDGVGKSSLLSLLAGARQIQAGLVEVLGGDMRQSAHRRQVGPRIAYMPQGLGRNLYPTLSVEENLQFFGRLFGHDPDERARRIAMLTRATDLQAFLHRAAGKLSGGMKQKLGLCCALIHDPDLLILDEPTTGVDPLARAQFWDLIAGIRGQRPGMSVVVATAYMDEAQHFDWLVGMDDGHILATGTPAELLRRTASSSLESAFIGLLPEHKTRDHSAVIIPPLQVDEQDIAIEARDLTMRFGDFIAVDHVSFRIRRGEIFGFLGSNGCGKTTTMKMLTGLLQPSEGQAWLFGQAIDAADLATRRRVGYMTQAFSLYGELTVRQNLVLHAQLFSVPDADIPERVHEMMQRFGLTGVTDSLPGQLPLGMRQRLSLAVAMVHRPELLILDEPTSGVDPVARDAFWQLLVELSRRDQVTIFISTHFMNEAERCDRMSMMHAGRVLDSDTPARLVAKRGARSLEEAFIGYLLEAAGETGTLPATTSGHAPAPIGTVHAHPLGAHRQRSAFSLQRMLAWLWRETLELQRDPIRATLALAGSVLLMFVIGFGISMDVEDLRYAVLDHDQTTLSRDYALQLSGSRYFIEQPAIIDHADLDRRMRSGELMLALEIPEGFARDALRGRNVQIGAWVDGAMPQRAETVQGYVQGMHQHWLAGKVAERVGNPPMAAHIETRFRYNPDVQSLPAMVPAVIPVLLLLLPAMLAALAVVREKETGAIINLYVTPTTRTEFLIGKQLPYVALALLNFLIMSVLAVTIFDVPVRGSYPTLLLAALIFSIASTGMGLLASSVTRSQIAALFITMIATLVPVTQFAGLIDPVPALEGVGRWIGEVHPATHMITISRGVFSKALGFGDLPDAFRTMTLSIPVILGLAIALLRKQER